MDRALKERLVGAIVLIVVAVLVVPVFLDGPSNDDDVVTRQVNLPGQNDQPRRQQTIVLERDRELPVPVVSTEPEPRDDAIVTAEPPAPEPEPPQVEPQKSGSSVEKAVAQANPEPATRPATAPQAGSLWAVQLGSFSNRANAEKLAADLRADGYAAFLSGLSTGSGQLHRVRVGPQKDREAAEDVASALASAGHAGQVVAHP